MDEDDTSPLGGVIDSVQHTAGRSLTDYRCSCLDLRRVVLALLSILAVPASVSVSCVHSTARWDRRRHGGARTSLPPVLGVGVWAWVRQANGEFGQS